MQKLSFPVRVVAAIIGFAGITYLLFNGFPTIWNGYAGHRMGMGLMGLGGMGIMMLLVWGLLITVVVIIVNQLLRLGGEKSRGQQNSRNAIALLKERYARGEIDKATFEAIKKDLNRS